jgi:hypothetical protein
VKSKLIAVNPFLGMAADIKLPKGRGEDVDINPFSPEERDLIIEHFKTANSEYASLDVVKLVGNSAEIIYKHYAGAKRDLTAPDID